MIALLLQAERINKLLSQPTKNLYVKVMMTIGQVSPYWMYSLLLGLFALKLPLGAFISLRTSIRDWEVTSWTRVCLSFRFLICWWLEWE